MVHLESRGKGRVRILWDSLILNLGEDFERSVRQLSFYLRNSLCMELFREFKFPFPKSLLKLLFLILCKETSVYFMNLRTAVLEKHSVFCLSTSFISNGFN